jgi:hypothetical protein
LTAQEIIGVATAVRAHVQACFDREAELMLMEDPSNADIDTGWPA